ncbi:MAG: GNAT family N-acetyltransferase [Cyanobacteria bacterium J06638_38]
MAIAQLQLAFMCIFSGIIKPAIPTMDLVIAQHFYQLWLDNNVPENQIDDNWLDITLKFMQQARQESKFQTFVAQVETEVDYQEADYKIVGSVSCQLFAGLYPNIRRDRTYGYIWNVYVASDYRLQGIATELTKAAVAYLKSLNCTKALLHASPSGQPVYQSIGFIPSNEMMLDLS